jgi:hypothetical protein
VWFNKAGHDAGCVPGGVADWAQPEDMARTQGTMANNLMSLMLSIELSVLFCDWTVYFYFFNLSRAV